MTFVHSAKEQTATETPYHESPSRGFASGETFTTLSEAVGSSVPWDSSASHQEAKRDKLEDLSKSMRSKGISKAS